MASDMAGATGALTRRGSLQTAAALGGVLLAGCGPRGAGGEDSLGGRTARSVPVTVWVRSLSDKGAVDPITPLVEQRYPHLGVTVEAISGIYDKLAVALAGGSVPVLSVINQGNGVFLIGKNAFLSLQPYLARDRSASQELRHYAPVALQMYTHTKNLYAIPVTNESIVVWYNEDLVRQHNLVPPHEFEHDPQRWNWDTLLEYGRKLNRGRGQDREVFGLWIGPRSWQSAWGNPILCNGGRFMTDDQTKLVLSEPPSVEAMQWTVDTIWKHDVAPAVATEKETPVEQLFTRGRVAIVMFGEFFRRSLFGPRTPQGTAFKFNLVQLPFAPRTRKRANVFHALGLAALREGKTPEGAWQYLTVFMTKEAQQFITDRWASRGGNQQTYEPWLRNNAGGGPPANYAAITKSDAHGQRGPASPYLAANELYEPMNRLIPQIFDNKVPVRTGLEQIDQETNARLEPAVRAATGRR